MTTQPELAPPPVPDEIVIECITVAQTEATLKRHRDCEIYIRAAEAGRGNFLWRYTAWQGARAAEWHRAQRQGTQPKASTSAVLGELFKDWEAA